jgi:hypothetical protein
MNISPLKSIQVPSLHTPLQPNPQAPFNLKKTCRFSDPPVLLYHQLLKHPPVYWKKGSASMNAMKNGFNEMVYLTLYENTLQLKKASSFDCTTNNDCRTF